MDGRPRHIEDELLLCYLVARITPQLAQLPTLPKRKVETNCNTDKNLAQILFLCGEEDVLKTILFNFLSYCYAEKNLLASQRV